MRLKSVFIRFYKSFNYDYVRKINQDVRRRPWEFVKEQFYPYIEIPIDPKITTVVGANESGKSHLLSAIEKGITGHGTAGGMHSAIASRDMCRYSNFFTGTKDGLNRPDFGFAWETEGVEDERLVKEACGISAEQDVRQFLLFRTDGTNITVYVPDGDTFKEFAVKTLTAEWLPNVFRIESAIALPDSVSIEMLLRERLDDLPTWPAPEREYAARLLRVGPTLYNSLGNLQPPSDAQVGNLTQKHYEELIVLRDQIEPSDSRLRDFEIRRKIAEFNLAYDLIFNIARIDPTILRLLKDAIDEGDGGAGIVRTIEGKLNDALKSQLRFERIWSQDRDFDLTVKTSGYDLEFVISDRTGGHYTFDERSSGLKHFLSYYIQYLVHESQGRSEILLMDEPDAFLSGDAQQDLLKVFEMFADPNLAPRSAGTRVPTQVIYVTHSPFLIDKNHSERVRALEKADGNKGTRILPGSAQNRYEPLRSAFGPFVGETTFMSRCNLVVEGPGDQILLAGSAAYLRKLNDVPESQMLDLNQISIVPAGGGTSVAYLVYLARGRDREKPAVIVLLDSDTEGDTAKREMTKRGPHPENSAILKGDLIIQLGDVTLGEVDPTVSEGRKSESAFEVLEDLVPLRLAIQVARRFVQDIFYLRDDALEPLNEANVRASMKAMADEAKKSGKTVKAPHFTALQRIVSALESERALSMDKVAFARTLVDLLPSLSRQHVLQGPAAGENVDADPLDLRKFERNMRALFARLYRLQRNAESDVREKRMRQRVDEKITIFHTDFPDGAHPTRDAGLQLLHDILAELEGDDVEATYIRHEIPTIITTHRLREDPVELIPELENFMASVDRLKNAKHFAVEAKEEVLSRRDSPRVRLQANVEPEAKTGLTEEKVPAKQKSDRRGGMSSRADDDEIKGKDLAVSPTTNARGGELPNSAQ